MNTETIKKLKERAKEMLEDNYDRKIGDEEIYTIICELENFYTAYEKEKEKNKELNWKYTASWVDEHFVSKDKIKAKIEELEKQDRENRMSHNYLVIPVLQSLLEKE